MYTHVFIQYIYSIPFNVFIFYLYLYIYVCVNVWWVLLCIAAVSVQTRSTSCAADWRVTLKFLPLHCLIWLCRIGKLSTNSTLGDTFHSTCLAAVTVRVALAQASGCEDWT